jgi:pyruvate dehydrogenase E1 component beta subunit
MTRTINTNQALNEAIDEEMERDDDVLVWGEDVGEFGGVFGEMAGLYEEYGADRVRDTPLSEIGIAGMALGAAVGGLRPVAELQFADFVATAGDETFNQIPKMPYVSGGRLKAPLTLFAAQGAGIAAGAQHSQTVHAWLGNVPGWVVVCPTTPAEAKGLLKSCIRDDNPCVFLPHKLTGEMEGEVPDDDDFTLPLGEAEVVQEGDDVTIVANQLMYYRTLEALDEVDVDAEIILPRTISPLDLDTIVESVEKTGRLVVADEAVLRYGTQGYIANQVAQNAFFSLDAPPATVGIKDSPIPFSPPLEGEVQPPTERIVAAIRSLF